MTPEVRSRDVARSPRQDYTANPSPDPLRDSLVGYSRTWESAVTKRGKSWNGWTKPSPQSKNGRAGKRLRVLKELNTARNPQISIDPPSSVIHACPRQALVVRTDRSGNHDTGCVGRGARQGRVAGDRRRRRNARRRPRQIHGTGRRQGRQSRRHPHGQRVRPTGRRKRKAISSPGGSTRRRDCACSTPGRARRPTTRHSPGRSPRPRPSGSAAETR